MLNFFIVQEDQKKSEMASLYYTHQKIKLQPGEVKIVDMKLHLKSSKSLVRGCVLLLH